MIADRLPWLKIGRFELSVAKVDDSRLGDTLRAAMSRGDAWPVRIAGRILHRLRLWAWRRAVRIEIARPKSDFPCSLCGSPASRRPEDHNDGCFMAEFLRRDQARRRNVAAYRRWKASKGGGSDGQTQGQGRQEVLR